VWWTGTPESRDEVHLKVETRLRDERCVCTRSPPRAKTEGSARLSSTGLCGGLEHLKIETRLRDERFESVKVRVSV
jgi:hypothetical protein